MLWAEVLLGPIMMAMVMVPVFVRKDFQSRYGLGAYMFAFAINSGIWLIAARLIAASL